MLFNSVTYFLFFIIVFLCYWFLFKNSLKKQNILLLIASYIFYGWWSWKFLLLLILSTLLDYLYGFAVFNSKKKVAKLFLIFSILNNLGILFIFKYYNFFLNEIQNLLLKIGLHYNPLLLSTLLPIGISFYTFHGMSYVFDIYNKKSVPVRNIIDYSVFVSFFPLLVAGPIERAHHLLPQIQKKRIFNYLQATQGSRLILWGLIKKVVIADNLAIIADSVFNNYSNLSGISLIIGAIAFSFQIYCDFSGYSDIAIGSAKILGFELLTNFKFPYFSRNIAEFWRRWHISLSSWFKDYLYIPLGGSRNGLFSKIRNTFIIFLISGFWHGASWNFIIWGTIHALLFLPSLLFKKNRLYADEIVAYNRFYPTLKETFQIITTFMFVTFAWIFFRMQYLNDAIGFIKKIIFDFSLSSKDLTINNLIILIYIIPLLTLDWKFRKNEI
jgi:D-alanyl-lipoteichoic acid acyltransferase DltB (MBOAT superfamily)